MAGTPDPAQIAKAVRVASEAVFTTMLGIEIRAGEPYAIGEKALGAVAELANMIIGNFRNLAEADLG